jgi:type I restriction enzyme R subunit
MNEAETRAEHIDPALKAAGWGVVEGSKVLREYPITLGRLEGVGGKRGKGLCADYVLVYRNRKLAIIEAKAWDEELTLGVGQAKNYAGKMELRFAYSTNGQGLYGIDMKTGKEAECTYPTPDELWGKTFPSTGTGASAAEAWRDRFSAIPFPDKSGTWSIRFYQEIAVNNVLERIAGGGDRALLTLATGTGKTSIESRERGRPAKIDAWFGPPNAPPLEAAAHPPTPP